MAEPTKPVRSQALPVLHKNVPRLHLSPSIIQLTLSKQKSSSNLHSKRTSPRLQPNISLSVIRKPKLINVSGMLSNRLKQIAPRLTKKLELARPSLTPLKSQSYSSKLRQLQTKSTPRLVKYEEHPLTDFEKQEVKQFRNTYYFGDKAWQAKQRLGRRFWETHTENGEVVYRCIVGDHVAYRYELVAQIGEGAFGAVYEVFDHKHQELCALKVLKQVPDQLKGVEVELLKRVKAKDLFQTSHIVRILHSFQFRKYSFFTTELLGKTLLDLLIERKYCGFLMDQLRPIKSQLLRALIYLSNFSAIHCDIKPENVLVQSWDPLVVNLIDFGSACYEHKKVYNYIQSRFYRAPEILLDIEYSRSIDMWSLGCMLAELYTGAPLFPGDNEPEQLQLIIDILGEPPPELLTKARNISIFLDQHGNKSYSVKTTEVQQLDAILAGADPGFIEIVKGKQYVECLEWKASKRLTPQAALESPWLTQ